MADGTIRWRNDLTDTLYEIKLKDNGDGTYSLSAALVTTPTIDIGDVTLLTGSAVIGKVGIDQTTPGTTNGVQVVAALPAGTNNIGDVDIATQPAEECSTVAEYNIALTLATTEYSQALPANCRKVVFRCRTAFDVRYAWVTGKVATPTAPYQTLRASAEYAIDGIKLATGTVYLASATAAVVVEMEAWS